MALRQLRGTDAPVAEAGSYLTDEVFLYRVAGSVLGGQDDVVELEDCYLLDVVHVPVSDLRQRRLRVVIPAPIAGSEPESPVLLSAQ